jgi:hypothetical protein
MTVPVDAINAQRLTRWATRLKEQHATALLLIGVGHDDKAGQIVICVPEEISNSMIMAVLLKAVQELGG